MSDLEKEFEEGIKHLNEKIRRLEHEVPEVKEKNMTEKCMECGKNVTVQIMKNTGLCSENCRKAFFGETKKASAQVDAGITNLLSQPTGEINKRGIV